MFLLNLVNLLKKKNFIKLSKCNGGNIRAHTKNIPTSKEWYNSLYSFNKNPIRFIPAVYNYTFNLFKSYFNITNYLLDKKILSDNYKKIRRVSGKKIWVGYPEIKHLNHKLNITIYIYNRIYNLLKKKINSLEFSWGSVLQPEQYLYNYENKKRKIHNFNIIKKKFPLYTGTNKIIYNNNKDFYIKIIKWFILDKHTYILEHKQKIIDSIINNQKKDILNLLNVIKIKRYNYLINQFNKELIYLKYKQKILYNEFKCNELYLSHIIKLIENLYNKKVECNIISLKHYYLSSSILLQIIATKIKSPKNRGRYLLPIDYAIDKLRMPILSKNKLTGEDKPFISIQNIKLQNFVFQEKDSLEQFISNNTKFKIWSDENINKIILNNLENKIIAGVFIKITGRLTKRYKAERSVEKLRFKGTLKNVYSAHKNLSSSLSRGYNNINIEKTTINSKVRIGAFGLTGWVASY